MVVVVVLVVVVVVVIAAGAAAAAAVAVAVAAVGGFDGISATMSSHASYESSAAGAATSATHKQPPESTTATTYNNNNNNNNNGGGGDDNGNVGAEVESGVVASSVPACVFQCRKCLAIVGDNFAQTAANQEMQMICLSSECRWFWAFVVCCRLSSGWFGVFCCLVSLGLVLLPLRCFCCPCRSAVLVLCLFLRRRNHDGVCSSSCDCQVSLTRHSSSMARVFACGRNDRNASGQETEAVAERF